jgi:hypothetical protein
VFFFVSLFLMLSLPISFLTLLTHPLSLLADDMLTTQADLENLTPESIISAAQLYVFDQTH